MLLGVIERKQPLKALVVTQFLQYTLKRYTLYYAYKCVAIVSVMTKFDYACSTSEMFDQSLSAVAEQSLKQLSLQSHSYQDKHMTIWSF